MEPDDRLLDQYILDQAPRRSPRICFLPTASGDNDNYIRRFYDAFTRLDCRPSHLSLFRPPRGGPAPHLLEQEIIYVGGGSTRNMLALWNVWDLEEALRTAWESGIVLCGVSAGSLCWFDEGLSDSVVPGRYEKLGALGFLAGSHCPHYDGEPDRRPAYHRLIGSGELATGVAADDGVALHYVGLTLDVVVRSRPAAKAYLVERDGDGVVEKALSSRYLGNAPLYA